MDPDLIIELLIGFAIASICALLGYVAASKDIGVEVDPEWLELAGFREDGLKGWSLILPPFDQVGAIAEMYVSFHETGTSICLCQGVPDDPKVADDMIVLTSLPPRLYRHDVRRLCAALGVQLKV